jgi:hypothetical protein
VVRDETYVRVNGVWRYVYRAVDQHGQVIDVLLTVHRDAAAAHRFFTRALRMLKVIPSEVVTDAAPVYLAVLEELVPAAGHQVEQYPNNPIEACTARNWVSVLTCGSVCRRLLLRRQAVRHGRVVRIPVPASGAAVDRVGPAG